MPLIAILTAFLFQKVLAYPVESRNIHDLAILKWQRSLK